MVIGAERQKVIPITHTATIFSNWLHIIWYEAVIYHVEVENNCRVNRRRLQQQHQKQQQSHSFS